MPDIRLSPGGIVPRDMDARQWATYQTQQRADYYRSGQTAYDTGTGFWIGDVAGVPKLSIGNSAGNKVTWDGSTLSIVGTITATTGTIGGWTLGATALTAGSGATTVGLDSGGTNPAIYAGSATPASAPFRVTQAGALTATSATITGSISLTNTAQTFTPNWSIGFSSAPTGDLTYLDLGNVVFIWNATGSAMTGTSNAIGFTLDNLPTAIRPSVQKDIICFVIDQGVTYSGSALISSVGVVTFKLGTVSGTHLLQGDFTNSGTKGLPAGWIMTYAK